jgi:hypothetical protein
VLRDFQIVNVMIPVLADKVDCRDVAHRRPTILSRAAMAGAHTMTGKR